uniref:Uncharacterized protein n=1 Tax=Tanacetum cinerariifolium TaxID=118510 RepID=A0A6L2LWZ7_TANCI|nr:hypothetical protein [Tanacetum cinerariifolium]
MAVHSAPPAPLSDGQRTMLLCLLMQKQSGCNILRPVGLWRLDDFLKMKLPKRRVYALKWQVFLNSYNLVENLREGIENGTRDQHFDSLN